MCSLPSRAERVDASTASCRSPAAAPRARTRRPAAGGRPSRAARRRRPARRPAWPTMAARRGRGRRAARRRRGPSRPGAISQATPPPIGLVGSSSPERRARDVEDLERLVDVVGQQEAGDRVDGLRGVDLVDARLGRGRRRRRRRRRAGTASRAGTVSRGPQAQAARRRLGHRGRAPAPRRGAGRAASSVRPNASTRRARVTVSAPARRQLGASPVAAGGPSVPSAARGAQQAAVVGEAEQLLADAVEAAATTSSCSSASAMRGERRLGRLVGLAGVRAVAGVLGGEPRAHGGAERRGARRSSARCARAACAWTRAGAAPSTGSTSIAPSAQPSSRSVAVQLDLPLQPQRHPRLRPRGDADRVGVDALQQREAPQLVGDERVVQARAHDVLSGRLQPGVGGAERHGAAVVGRRRRRSAAPPPRPGGRVVAAASRPPLAAATPASQATR